MKTLTLRILTFIMAILFLCAPVGATEKRDSVIVSLITCWPGEEIYELCGHEAIRVRSAEMDSIWNYGLFSFNQPGFVYRFVKGETDYMLGAYPFDRFMPEYMLTGRRVVEQELNLTQEESRRLLSMLRTEALPENRVYRYNYVKDNCGTRILDRLDSAIDSRIIYPDSIRYGSYRREMRSYHRKYPWYQFGIDLALGSGLDLPIGPREEMFVPLEMMRNADAAHLADGRPLVRETRVIYEGRGDVTLPATHPLLTPMAAGIAILLISVGASVWMIRRKRLLTWLYMIWFGICGIAGCVIAFLVFCSEHEATSPNMLLLWLNPLQLFLGIFCVARGRWKIPAIVMAYYNIIVVGVLLIVWAFQLQSANPAVFPMEGATLILAITYAIIAPLRSYKDTTTSPRRVGKHEKNSTNGARNAGRRSSRDTGGNRRSPSGGRNSR